MRSDRWKYLAIVALSVVILIANVWAVNHFFTSRFTGGNDFYSRWAGGRALLVDGRDPYSLEVTAEIQAVKKINPSNLGKGSFAYPLHVVFLYLPLVYLDYPLALAIWMVISIWLAVATVFILLRLFNWRLNPLAAAALSVATILMYPVARSIILGQFTIQVTFFLAASLLLLRQRRDGWAGVALAATSVKGQMLIFVGPWLVIWALAQRRWRYVILLLLAGLALFAAALVLFPGWPLSFVADVQRYAGVAGGKNPLLIAADKIAPGFGQPIRYGLAVALLTATALACWRARHDQGDYFMRATYWTIVASLLVVFQTGSTNQLLLLIPLFDWLARLDRMPHGRLLVVAIVPALVILPWLLFLATKSGSAESAILFLPLPLLALLALIGIEVHDWQTGRGPLSASTSSAS